MQQKNLGTHAKRLLGLPRILGTKWYFNEWANVEIIGHYSDIQNAV